MLAVRVRSLPSGLVGLASGSGSFAHTAMSHDWLCPASGKYTRCNDFRLHMYILLLSTAVLPALHAQDTMAPKKDDAPKEEKKEEIKTDVKILKCDMSEEMTNDVVEITKSVWGKHKLHKDVATAIKAAFDEKHPPADNKATSGVWHCIVGSDFACSVTHETHFSCYWSCNNVKLLIWKSKDSPFD